MTRLIIDPLTRVEGHGRISQNRVDRTDHHEEGHHDGIDVEDDKEDIAQASWLTIL